MYFIVHVRHRYCCRALPTSPTPTEPGVLDPCCSSQPPPQARRVAELQQPPSGSSSSRDDKRSKAHVFPREGSARSRSRAGAATLAPLCQQQRQHPEAARGQGQTPQGWRRRYCWQGAALGAALSIPSPARQSAEEPRATRHRQRCGGQGKGNIRQLPTAPRAPSTSNRFLCSGQATHWHGRGPRPARGAASAWPGVVGEAEAAAGRERGAAEGHLAAAEGEDPAGGAAAPPGHHETAQGAGQLTVLYKRWGSPGPPSLLCGWGQTTPHGDRHWLPTSSRAPAV